MSQRVDRQNWIRVLLLLSGAVGLVYSQDQVSLHHFVALQRTFPFHFWSLLPFTWTLLTSWWV